MSSDVYRQHSDLEGLGIRYSEPADGDQFAIWLSNPEAACDFPMGEPQEIQEATKRWVEFYKQQAALTAVYQGIPVGISILFLQNYERIKHQALHILFVANEYRRLGIGSALLSETVHWARDQHHIELLHVEVYGNEETEHFYRKRGFTVYARQSRWTKEAGVYRSRICLERFL